MAVGPRLAALCLALVPALARAQPEPPPAELEPPRALSDTAVPYPAGAPPQTDPVVVRVKITVDATGAVQKVDLLSSPQPIFDDAVVKAAEGFRFEPGRFQGKPVPVEVTFAHTFLPPPPPPPPAEEGPPLVSALRGRLVELGTRAPVAGATVAAQIGDRHYSVFADARGRFRLPLPEGTFRVTVNAPGHNAFVQEERLAPEQELAVSYFVERERYDPYEIIVYGDQRREEVTRITLRGPEIKQVPGTFGDPFRVIQTLPGVASAVSLLPFPIVRGASPSSTGFLLDGTRVPLLFHLLSGPSVVHPEIIDEVQFYPGGAPVLYGGYTGGIVDGRTHRPHGDEHLVDVDANLLEAGGLVREPLPFLDANVTAAGRYGYPGFVLGLATNQASLSYWDYQLRIDGGNPRDGWTVFAFGARDELDTVSPTADPNDPNPPLVPTLILGFHRLDVRLYKGLGTVDTTYRLVLGYDKTLSSGSNVSTLVLEPSVTWRWRPSESFTLVAGVQGSSHWFNQGAPSQAAPGNVDLSTIVGDLHVLAVGSALVESIWRPTPRWLVRPGVRLDVYDDGTTTVASVDPRLTVRYRLAPDATADDSSPWLKAAVGIYHQPPRFVLPLPGLDTMPLKYGLLRSIQTSVGAEAPLPDHFSLDANAYFSYLDPTIFDLAVNAQDLNNPANVTLFPTTTVPPDSTAQMVLDRLLTPQTGRAYGVEALLRRESRDGVYGWLSYTLSRSERLRDGAWVPYDFDRTHLLNLVVGMPLPREWDFGLRLQYQSGKPATTTAGYNTARTDGYVRIDLRIDKRAVWKDWLLDFYVDIANVALLPEEVTPGNTLHYVLPTVGVRGRF
jgi:TonB family protein